MTNKLPVVVRTNTKRPKFYRILSVGPARTGEMWAWVDDASPKPGHESLGHGMRENGTYSWSVAEIEAKLAKGKLVVVL